MTAPAPRLHYIPELLEIHADELAYLWGQRRAALFDARVAVRLLQLLVQQPDPQTGPIPTGALTPAMLVHLLYFAVMIAVGLVFTTRRLKALFLD